MNKQLRKIILAGLVAGLGSTAPAVVAAPGDVPNGMWQTPDRHMDYDFQFCSNGRDLCVKLTGLRDGIDTPRNREFLNTYLLEDARPAGRNKWQGTIRLLGHTANGTVTFVPNEKMVVHGCVYVVLCETFVLIPGL